MKPSIVLLILSAFVALLLQPATAAEPGGPATMPLGQSQELVKNGFGTRSKMMLSLYDCSLYLPQKSNDATSILEADQLMAIRIEITSRFVSQAKMLSALKTGFQSSTGGKTAAIASQINELSACFSDSIEMGDVFVLAYAPNSGVTVYKNNQPKGTVGDLEFKKALFGIWLGNNSIDANLRVAMLGQ